MIKFIDIRLEVEILPGDGAWVGTNEQFGYRIEGTSPEDVVNKFKNFLLRPKKAAAPLPTEEEPTEEEPTEEEPTEEEPTEEEPTEEEEDQTEAELNQDLSQLGKGDLRKIVESKGLYQKGMTKDEMLEALNPAKENYELDFS